jgi:transcriptional regulator with XRE-family HTH domain
MKDQRHPVDVHVGDRLRTRRNARDLSQTALGDAVGVTFQQVQKYERGANRISASRLYEFAQVLAVEVGFFFEGMPRGVLAKTAAGRARKHA